MAFGEIRNDAVHIMINCQVFAENGIAVNYRTAHGILACNVILCNHESPSGGETFVTRKVTRAAANIVSVNQDVLYFRNLNAMRDWVHAKGFVEAMWLMLQQDEPEDIEIATGVSTSVREFTRMAFAEVGVELEFMGSGENEVGVVFSNSDQNANVKVGQEVVKIDPNYFRPAEVDMLIGDASKAKEKLGWEPKVGMKELITEMMDSDLNQLNRK